MKLLLQQIKHLKETEVKISYSEKNEIIEQMVHYITQFDQQIDGYLESKIFRIPVHQIYYIEATDHKTFLYMKDAVYESKKTVQNLEETLPVSTFYRIGKGILLNLNAMKSVKPYPNHRLLVELKNGEHLIVSRRYIPGLKDCLKREEKR